MSKNHQIYGNYAPRIDRIKNTPRDDLGEPVAETTGCKESAQGGVNKHYTFVRAIECVLSKPLEGPWVIYVSKFKLHSYAV